MTNADEIRNMTDEELATLFTKVMAGNSGARLDGIWQEKGMEENQRYFTKLNWLDWLKQEVTPMTKEEKLYEAVRTIKRFCERSDDCGYCVGYAWCVAMRQGGGLNTPNHWPDPEEGDGEDG